MSIHNSVHNTPHNSDDEEPNNVVTLISKLDLSHPLHLHPNDSTSLTIVSIKLKGTKNYNVWSCAMLLALEDCTIGPQVYEIAGGLPVEKPLLHLPSLTTNECVDGEFSCVDIVNNAYFRIDLLNSVLCSLGFEDDVINLYYKILLKSLDIGLKPLVSENDTNNFLGYVHKHKMMYVYVELVETTETNSDEDGEGDNEHDSKDGHSHANDIIDDEHLVDEVEVNMSAFNFQIEGQYEDGQADLIQPLVTVTEDDLEVLDYDSLESDQEDVPENARRNNVFVDKDEGPKEDISRKGKEVNEDAEEDKKYCPWVLYLTKRDKAKWVVKTYKDVHKCLQSRKIKHCTSTFLAKHITDLLIMNPKIPVKAIQEQMQKKFHVVVSKTKAFRAKAKAQVYLKGDVKVQYSLLRDYVSELHKCNPDTTIKIDVYREEDPEKTTRMFRRIYVCLGALKMGFKEGGMELLGLDGAFMRGQYHGQMLTVVGVDANNGIYPVAYGIVESENQYSWTWFLTCLADDLDLFSNSNFTFITDRQKGVLPDV
ncbi:ATP-dependent (S)-NAD(P)H-hydrate dehydratase [Tanacetum coccineum]